LLSFKITGLGGFAARRRRAGSAVPARIALAVVRTARRVGGT